MSFTSLPVLEETLGLTDTPTPVLLIDIRTMPYEPTNQQSDIAKCYGAIIQKWMKLHPDLTETPYEDYAILFAIAHPVTRYIYGGGLFHNVEFQSLEDGVAELLGDLVPSFPLSPEVEAEMEIAAEGFEAKSVDPESEIQTVRIHLR